MREQAIWIPKEVLQKENKNKYQQQNSKCKGPEAAQIARLGPSAQESNRAADTGCGSEFPGTAAAMGLLRGAEGREREGSWPGGMEQQQEDLELEEGSRSGRGRRASGNHLIQNLQGNCCRRLKRDLNILSCGIW